MLNLTRSFKHFSIPATFLGFIIITLSVSIISLPKESQKNEKRTCSNIFMDDFSITKYGKDGARKLITLSGKRLAPGPKKLGPFYVSALKEFVISDVRVEFYDTGKITATIVSGKAIFDNGPLGFAGGRDRGNVFPGRIKFIESPCLMTEGRRALSSEVLWWDGMTGAVRAEDGCVLSYELGRLKADRIDSDVYLKNFTYNERKIPLKRLSGMFLKSPGG